MEGDHKNTQLQQNTDIKQQQRGLIEQIYRNTKDMEHFLVFSQKLHQSLMEMIQYYLLNKEDSKKIK
jgi:hypothetical protein